MKVLVINPGATSTKVAVFEEEQELLKKSIIHTAQELEGFDRSSASGLCWRRWRRGASGWRISTPCVAVAACTVLSPPAPTPSATG